MKPPVQRDPQSMFIALAAVAVLLVLIGLMVATADPTPVVTTHTEEIQ